MADSGLFHRSFFVRLFFLAVCTDCGYRDGWIDRYQEWFGPFAVVLSLGLGAAVVLISRRNKEREAYLLESIAELRRVSWLSTDDTKKLTIIVCVVVIIFAAILAVFDLSWARVLGLILT